MKHYYPFSIFLKHQFGESVQKISVDAGFNCPNRDGTKGISGCSFCNNTAFSPALSNRGTNLEFQIRQGIQKVQSRKKVQKFIVYFQPFSNTYGSPNYLRKIYDIALSFKEVVGIAVGTRPDCLSDEILDIINEYSSKIHFWLEIGLETIHDETLEKINRGHNYKEFIDSYTKARKIPNLLICIHLIHGLPNETKEMMINTVKEVSRLKPDAVKFHQLEIVKGTELEKDYYEGKIKLLSITDYLEILGESLKELDENIVIQRLFGFTPSEYLIAPILTKKVNLNQLAENYLRENRIFQGQNNSKENK